MAFLSLAIFTSGRKKYIFRFLVVILGFAIVSFVLFQLPRISSHARTVAVMTNIIFKNDRLHWLSYLTDDPLQQQMRIELKNGRTINVVTFEPPTYDKMLVLYAPWATKANQSPEMLRITETFARLGFLVVAYSREEGDPVTLPTRQTNEDLVNLTLHFLDDPTRHISSVGFFGVSIGNGPIFAAASDQALQDRASFILAFSPFFDSEDQPDFILHGKASFQNTHVQLQPSPKYVQDLTAMGSRNGYPTLEQLFASEFYKNAGREISPVHFVSRVRAPVYILHTKDDKVFPYTNSLQLADAIRPYAPVKLLLTDLMNHGSIRSFTWNTLRRYYLPEGLEYYRFMHAFLQEQMGD